MSTNNSPATLRTALGRVRGLGSAKEGTEHWWMQRLTAIALVPLCLWFAVSIVSLAGADLPTFKAWLSQPCAAVMMILTVGVTFHHAAAGLQIVIEDYVHTEWAKIAALIIVKFASFALAVAGIFAVLKIALGG